MYKDYNILEKEIKRFEKKHGKVEVIAVPKEDMNITDFDVALQSNPEDFYIGLFRPLNRNEYGIFQSHLNNQDSISAFEVITENCFLKGDQEIIKNDDYFIPLSNNQEILLNFVNHIVEKVKPYKIDDEKMTIYIKKEGVEDFDLKDVNDEDYYKMVFRKANRNDLRNFYINGAENIGNQENLLSSLCIEGNDSNLIMNDDSIFYTLTIGKGKTIVELLINQKLAYLKKN